MEALPRSDSGFVSFPEPRIPDPELRLGCPPDFVISEAADRRMERLMSRRTRTTRPWSGASLFPSGPQLATLVRSVAESPFPGWRWPNGRQPNGEDPRGRPPET